MSSLIETYDLKKYFPTGGGLFGAGRKVVHAVDGVSFHIQERETFGIVGESGCGKTTTARLLLRLLSPTHGSIRFDRKDILNLNRSEAKKLSREMQIIFQDPFSSLNPRKTVRQILSKPFRIHMNLSGKEIEDKVIELMEIVGLSPPHLYIDRYSHEFSGGQRQRIGIARAIALGPKFIAADEPVSALDMSIRAQILNLMKELRKQLKLTLLYISHDLAVVKAVTNRVAVMYVGKIVELADTEELYVNPMHPYTKSILSATPIPNPRVTRARERLIIKGEVPSPIDPPPGCRFHPRCPYAKDRCAKEEPNFIEVEKKHFIACFLHE